MVFPTHLEIGWTLIVGGVLTGILAEANQRWPQPLESLVGQFRCAGIARRDDPFIPFSQAARELYEAHINDLLGAAARQDAGGGVDPLLWCAYWIAPRFQEIYGRRPPSTKLERIPTYLFTYAHFEDHGDRLTGGDIGDYVDLCVKRGAFQAVLPGLGEMPASEPG